MDTFKIGDKVMCNGYEGVIIEVLTGQLFGMIHVRLARGEVCVSTAGVSRLISSYKNDEDGLESFVTAGRFGFHVSLKDTDADQFVGTVVCYQNQDQAITTAQQIVLN